MLTHISELLSADNASSLAYINGLPSPPDNAPHKPLDVLKELEKRGVFSHENVEPLIGLLTDLHRVDIINTCGVREYKNNAEQASKSSLVMEIKFILREREREREREISKCQLFQAMIAVVTPTPREIQGFFIKMFIIHPSEWH